MASHYEGPYFEQEYYQGYDAYGQPLGWYDSNGQLLSQSLGHSAASFQDTDNATETQLPEQTAHPNFYQGFSDMIDQFDPASNNECSTVPSTMMIYYNPPIYTDNPGYQVQEQHPLQQDLIPAGITAHSEPGMDAGDVFESGSQPMDSWYSDPNQSAYPLSMNSMSSKQNMPKTLFYPDPQAARLPELAEACESLHHLTVFERADIVSL